MSKQQLSIYGNLSVRGFPGTAILALLKISQTNNPAFLLMKIEQEISHLSHMRQLKISTSSEQIFKLFNQN